MSLNNLMAIAQNEIGVKESPAGSNNVKYNTAYYGHPVSGGDYQWCCAFIWWIFRQAGMSNLFYGGRKTARCTTLMNYMKKQGQQVRRGQYRVGDLVFFDWGKSDGYAYHIGILASTDGTSFDGVIEGNTSSTSNDNGGAVMLRKRNASQVVAVCRPAYTDMYTGGTITGAAGSSSYTSTVDFGLSSQIQASGEYYKIENLKGTVSDWLYGRRYRVIIAMEDGTSLDVSQLRCTFNIVKSAYLECNTSTVKIYNLNPDDENRLIKSGHTIIIEAGYAGSSYGVIFKGNIVQPLRSKENGVDYCLTLVSMDADRYVAYGLVAVALSAQQSARDAVDACVSKAGDVTKENFNVEEGVISNKTTQIKYPRGKVLFGSPTQYLSQISKSVNTTYYAEDGTINIIAPDELADDEILDLSPDSGLIGTPTQGTYSISCECLLNPRIKTNTLFHIDNKRITNYQYTPGQSVRGLDTNGIYRVIKLTHSGDTRGSSWKTSIEAISQAGILPGMYIGDDFYNS